MATEAELSPIENTDAREAVRIADKYLPFAGIEKRKALAHEIVVAINICYREFADEIVRRLRAANKEQP